MLPVNFQRKRHMMLDFRHNCYKANSTFRSSAHSRFWPYGYSHVRKGVVHSRFWSYGYSHERSRDKTEGTKMISFLGLVGVGARIKSLSHREWFSDFSLVPFCRQWPSEYSQLNEPFITNETTFASTVNALTLSMWAYGGWVPRFGMLEVSWYRILDKSRIYGSNMLYPDIPGTPIYRAKWFPPRIPVNRGPTVHDILSFLSWVAEEIIDPSRNIPLSLFIGIFIVVAVYLLFNLAIFLGPSLSHIPLNSSPFVLLYARTAWSGWGWFFASFCIISATYGAVSSNTISTTRFYHACARDGHLPRRERETEVSIDYGLLTPSLLTQFLLTVVYIMVGKHADQVVEKVMYTQWVYFVFVFVGIIILRFTRPNMRRPYKAPFIIPVFLTMASILMILSPVLDTEKNDDYIVNIVSKYGIAVGSIVTGIPFYLLCIYQKTRLSIFERASEKMTELCKKIGFHALELQAANRICWIAGIHNEQTVLLYCLEDFRYENLYYKVQMSGVVMVMVKKYTRFLLTVVYIMVGKHADQVVEKVMYTQWVYFVFVFVGIIILRFTRPNMRRPYKAPFIIPVFLTMASILMILSPVLDTEKNDDYIVNIVSKYGIAVGSIVTGIPFYLLCIYQKTRLSIFERASAPL
eukprot:sb/3462959/